MGRRTASESSTLLDSAVAESVGKIAHPLREGESRDYEPLLEMIGESRIVMIGEASHGTHEFYRERALITRRLIEEKGFAFVGIEGDWPETYHINQWVRGEAAESAEEALSVFKVYPTWMWGNTDTLHFIEWLRRHNTSLPADRRKTGFYGLDLYSLFASMEQVVRYLQSVDPEAAREAKQRYACFDPFNGNKDLYAYGTGLGIMQNCEDQAIAMLQDMRARRESLVQLSGDDEYFYALMAATVARDGERYYRAMYGGDVASWNLRDTHMVDTLDALLEHFSDGTKAVVWEHNTHIGGFRATADADGMFNVGQMVRERHPHESIAVGFGTYEGTVAASREWGQHPEAMRVPEAVAGSYDNVFHNVGSDRFLLLLKPLLEHDHADGLND